MHTFPAPSYPSSAGDVVRHGPNPPTPTWPLNPRGRPGLILKHHVLGIRGSQRTQRARAGGTLDPYRVTAYRIYERRKVKRTPGSRYIIHR